MNILCNVRQKWKKKEQASGHEMAEPLKIKMLLIII